MKTRISFNKNLFWDVRFEKLNKQKDAAFIIERVLNYGDEKDYRELKKIYNPLKIKKIAQKIDYINKKNINFWGVVFNIPPSSFKCTRKFLTKKQSAFLNR